MNILAAGDLSTAETAGTGDLDTLRIRLHGAAHRLLHSAAEGGALFEGAGDVLSNELSARIGIADLHDVDVDGTADELVELGLDGLDAYAALADQHAGTSGVDADGSLIGSTLDLDLGDGCFIVLLLEELADGVVLNQIIGKILLVGIPTSIPTPDNAYAEAIRINFLTHNLLLLVQNNGDVAGALPDVEGGTPCPGAITLERRALVGVDLRNVEIVLRKLEVVLCVGDGAAEELQNGFCCSLGSVEENSLCILNGLAADKVDNDLDLTGGNTDIPCGSMGTLFGILTTLSRFFLRPCCHNLFLLTYLPRVVFSEPRWPRKVRVGANSPSL